MSDNFDLKKYLIENKATTNSRMLSENEDIDNYVDDIVAIASSTQGYQSGLATPSGKEAITGISKELKNNGMLNQVSQALVAYINETPGFTVEDIESLKKHGFDMTGVKLTEMKKKHSKMLNEAETEKEYTVLSSYSSRNEYGDYDYAYVFGMDARSALINYLVAEEDYTADEAEDFVSEIETRFENYKRGSAEVWATDDPFYAILPGKVDTEKLENLVANM